MKKHKCEIKISIVVPIYNSEKYLTKCLESIAGQSYNNFEVIMINDGSTDLSEQICAGFIKDNRFKLYNQNNQGVSVARNNGIEKSSGNYIAFIDSDDFIAEDYLEKLVNICNGDEDLIVGGIIYHNEYKIRRRNQNQKRVPMEDTQINTNVYQEYLSQLKKRIPEPCFGAPYGKLFNRITILDNNLKFENGQNLAEDLVFNLRFLQSAVSVKATNYTGYYYRMFVASSLSRIAHSHEYTSQRWGIVVKEYNRLFESDKINDNERINKIAEKNIRLSVICDKRIKIVQKKKIFKKISNCNNWLFWREYIKVLGKNSLKRVYRGLQLLVFKIRSMKG